MRAAGLKTQKRYCKKDEIELAKALVQKEYDKKMLITPYVTPIDAFVSEWKSKYETGKNDIYFKYEYTTENCEAVRSKSEKMIADKLLLLGIPYVYETSLTLQNGSHVFPDFILLNKRTRETLFYEHFGMMDDPDYCKKALEKLDKYEINGIRLGENLLATFESSQKGINMK